MILLQNPPALRGECKKFLILGLQYLQEMDFFISDLPTTLFMPPVHTVGALEGVAFPGDSAQPSFHVARGPDKIIL